MTTLRIDLAYHGAGFAGWAVQPGERTVEGELGAALETLLGEPVSLTVAGRTDAGVHAWRQVASLACEPPDGDVAYSLNGITSDDLVVHDAVTTENGFDARRDARSRTYCYRVLASPKASPFERGLSLWCPQRLDLAALERCAAALRGPHNFTAFTPTDTHHRHFERDIVRSEWKVRPIRAPTIEPVPRQPRSAEHEEMPACMLEFWIESRAFMRGMVRALVGTMLEVGSGRRDVADFERLLEGAPRKQAGDSARPHGLYLADVGY